MTIASSTRQVTMVIMLMLTAVAALALGLRDADAAPKCRAVGASCMRNAQCCNKQCWHPPSAKKNILGTCVAGSRDGEACSQDSDCFSTHCVDGVCCNTACTGSCFTCDGGTCWPKATGESCDDGLFCTATDTCDGAGSCQGTGSTCPLDSQSEVCSECDEVSDSCSQNEGLTCGLGNGQPCAGSFQCGSGYCVDGVCCESACSGTCEACSDAKTGVSNGTCAPISASTDPDEECVDGLCITGLCNGSRFCGAIDAGTDPRDECPDDPCVTGMCDGAGGCGIVASDTPCNDGVGCSQLDRCDGYGSCVSTGNGCGMTPDGQHQCYCDEVTDSCSYDEASCVP